MKAIPLDLINIAIDGVKSVADENSLTMYGKTEEEKRLIKHIVDLCIIPLNVLIRNT